MLYITSPPIQATSPLFYILPNPSGRVILKVPSSSSSTTQLFPGWWGVVAVAVAVAITCCWSDTGNLLWYQGLYRYNDIANKPFLCLISCHHPPIPAANFILMNTGTRYYWLLPLLPRQCVAWRSMFGYCHKYISHLYLHISWDEFLNIMES